MKTYTTTQADTYDQIALREYGSDRAVRDMMAENGLRDPSILLVWRFIGGVVLRIPDLTPGTATVNELPAWRRPDA